jgi:predicted nucleic acid-binding Zn ribbon protein
MKETPEIFCDKCKNLMVRQIYKANFSLKGGGWAADLYSKKK